MQGNSDTNCPRLLPPPPLPFAMSNTVFPITGVDTKRRPYRRKLTGIQNGKRGIARWKPAHTFLRVRTGRGAESASR